MGTENLPMLTTRFDSIRARFADNFVPTSMRWVVNSLRTFICNYVLYSFGLMLQFIFRIQIADGKNELSAQLEDSHIDGFREELINFLFPSDEYVDEDGLMESVNDFSVDSMTESSVSEKADSNNFEEADFSVSMNEEGEEGFDPNMKKIKSDFYDGGVRNEKEGTESSVLMVGSSKVHEDDMRRVEEKPECSFIMKDEVVHGNSKRREEETDMCALMEGEESEKKEDNEEDETEGPALITKKFEYVSGRDIIGFEEPTTTMTFSFREFFVGPYVSDTQISELKSEKEKSPGSQSFQESHPCLNGSEAEILELKLVQEPVVQEVANKEVSELESEDEQSVGAQNFQEFYLSPNGSEYVQEHGFPGFDSSPNVSETEICEFKSEEDHVLQEEEKDGSVQEQRMFHGHSSSDQFSLKSEIFRFRDSSDEDDLDFNDNSFESDSESESSSSSGLIWANSDKADDLITYEFLAYQKGFEGLEPETLKLMEKLRAIDEFIELAPGKPENEDEKKGSNDSEKKLGELDSEEEDDDQDDFAWDDDELVQQMKMEMRNARQGGLPTILEDEEEEERESPKVAEDLKPLKIEEKLEFRDHIRDIQKVHRSYEEKMRKLDILNYQTLHALGLRQLKEPSAKPMILKNLLWSSKDERLMKKKKSSEGVESLVEELEMVYVGQVCLSWEILWWEYRKAIELKQCDREWGRRYNMVAGEFQLFQVLLQRFIENEPFQGPRIHNYVRNRCVIRNLLQVPAIKDDSMKENNVMTKDEEDAVSSERLAEIIRESMYIFCKFVRADKHDMNTNTFFKVPYQTKPTHLKDPAISHLLTDIQTQLHKKEKRLKDLVRSGNCIVRKFQKQSEEKVELDHEQMVAQVQLKLISRVLSLSKLRKDHLIWCNDKLKRISFLDRKIQVEPSFLLFPF
ncbi:uncharacterized protein LOC129310675 [Prosopis cineraria]|uniref:uncharacterized protein LOC129310675 n=1 Tax=Prosopis cineraria TaxID=364024 RepID=UPI00240E9F47|nr:uncharacterized protein LOC129310675 [Prosopis cineraria]